jgi:hypothetical protein
VVSVPGNVETSEDPAATRALLVGDRLPLRLHLVAVHVTPLLDTAATHKDTTVFRLLIGLNLDPDPLFQYDSGSGFCYDTGSINFTCLPLFLIEYRNLLKVICNFLNMLCLRK